MQLIICNYQELSTYLMTYNSNLLSFYQEFTEVQKINIDDSSYHIIKSGCPNNSLFNLILLPQNTKLQHFEQLEAIFTNEGLDFAWWLETDNLPVDVINNLHSDKYDYFGEVPGMRFNPNKKLQSPPKQKEKIEIKIIQDKHELKKWCEVIETGFDFDESTTNLYFDVFSKYLGSDNKFILLGAYINNILVATATMFIENSETVGFYNDTTLPEYRKLGVSSKLYQERLNICAKKDFNKILIQTSPAATSIAHKFGFEDINKYKVFNIKSS